LRLPPPLAPRVPAAFERGDDHATPYVVMIDNHPNAYPQTGLDKAAVVFEALAESGITRFMAVYIPGVSPDVPSIGPVRSARLYFVRWAMGMNGMYIHAGGAPDALKRAREAQEIIDVDALARSGGAYFTRIRTRKAPHEPLYQHGALSIRRLPVSGTLRSTIPNWVS
jgi:hypothetical protein